MTKYTTKDSGKRQEYNSGMKRDTQENKPSFQYLLPKKIPYHNQPLTRFAELMTRGKEKYGPRNWELANSEKEMERFKASALRHMIQWQCDEEDEDHMAAVMFNLLAYETTKWKLQQKSQKKQK